MSPLGFKVRAGCLICNAEAVHSLQSACALDGQHCGVVENFHLPAFQGNVYIFDSL